MCKHSATPRRDGPRKAEAKWWPLDPLRAFRNLSYALHRRVETGKADILPTFFFRLPPCLKNLCRSSQSLVGRLIKRETEKKGDRNDCSPSWGWVQLPPDPALFSTTFGEPIQLSYLLAMTFPLPLLGRSKEGRLTGSLLVDRGQLQLSLPSPHHALEGASPAPLPRTHDGRGAVASGDGSKFPVRKWGAPVTWQAAL